MEKEEEKVKKQGDEAIAGDAENDFMRRECWGTHPEHQLANKSVVKKVVITYAHDAPHDGFVNRMDCVMGIRES